MSFRQLFPNEQKMLTTKNKESLIHVNIHNERKCLKESNLEHEIAWKVNHMESKLLEM
jgi:hypothetical protein